MYGKEVTNKHGCVLLPPWKRLEYIPASVKARFGADEEALADVLRVRAARPEQHVVAAEATPPRVGRHGRPPLRLHDVQRQRSLAASRPPARRPAAARPPACRRCRASGGRRGHAAAARRSWSTLRATAAARAPGGRGARRGLPPVQPAIGPMERLDQGRLLRILRLGSMRAARPALELRRHDLGGQLRRAAPRAPASSRGRSA